MFTIGDKIKVNEELCPENKRDQKDFQFGSLNYFALFLAYEFEIVRTFRDDYHGEMIEVSAVDEPRFRSNLIFKTEDCVSAGKTMLKMLYDNLGSVNKYQSSIDELRAREVELIAFRGAKKAAGMKTENKVLIDNWAEIRRIRDKIKALEQNTEKVTKVKFNNKFYEFDCKEEDIPRKLRAIIREERKNARTIVAQKKEIAGNLSYEKVGGVLTKPGEFLKLNENFAINVIKAPKKPTTKDNYVGLEIEMFSSKDIPAMQKEFIAARLHKFVDITTDASLHSEGGSYYPMELRICLPENLLESHLKLICGVLKKNDCYANRSCGMHVHLDMRNRDPELCYKNLFKVQDIMLAIQPAARRTNKYCLPNTKSELKLSQFGNDEGGRRLAINTQAYTKGDRKTIEIRIHEGATKFKDIYNWVKFLTSTVNLTNDLPKVVKNIADLKNLNYLDTKTLDHLEERIEEYSA